MTAALRFGIMCYGNKLAAWEIECVRRLIASGTARPAVLIIDSRPVFGQSRRSRPWKRLWTLLRSPNQLWVFYERMFVDGRIPALASVEGPDLPGDLPRITCAVMRKGKFSEYFTPEDVERIRDYDLDFVLRFAFGIIRGEILRAPRYGVWSFHHGDEEKYRGGPPGFWEIYFGDPRTGVLLQRLTDKLDGGIPLRKGWFPTAGHSFAANRSVGLFGGADWPADVCRDIVAGKAEYVDGPPSTTSAPIYSAPNNRQMIRFALRLLANSLRRRRA